MFSLYEVEPSGTNSSGPFSVPEWFSQVISLKDAPRLHGLIAEGISQVTPELHTIVYQVTAGHGTSSEKEMYLRLTGRAKSYPDGAVHLNGLTYQVPGRIEEWTPGLGGKVIPSNVLEAVLKVAEASLYLIDVQSGQIIVASEYGQRSYEHQIPPRDLHDIFADSGVVEVLSRLRSVAAKNSGDVSTFVAKAIDKNDSTKTVIVRTVCVQSTAASSPYVITEIQPLKN